MPRGLYWYKRKPSKISIEDDTLVSNPNTSINILWKNIRGDSKDSRLCRIVNKNMMRARKRGLVVLTAILAYSLVIATGRAYAFRQNLQPALHTQQQSKEIIGEFGNHFVNRIRGGASVNIEIESSDEEETDDEEESPSLAEATRKKATEKATKVAKKSVAAALKSNAPKKSFGSFFRIPYIVKACLNPAIFLKMTAGYWKSLCNINYMADKVSLLA